MSVLFMFAFSIPLSMLENLLIIGVLLHLQTPNAYEKAWELLKDADGVLVPGGFEDRGVQGKILAAKYARENNVPYFGICLGMQIAVIEFARSIMKLHGANITEFNPATKHRTLFSCQRDPKPIWVQQCALDQGRLFFRSIAANLLSCIILSHKKTSDGSPAQAHSTDKRATSRAELVTAAAMAFRLSNIIGALNLVTFLLSVPVLGSGIWLRTRADGTECDHFLSSPAIALGAVLMAVSLAGLVGACCRITWLLWFYLLAVFALIVVLLCFTAFAFAVTNRGAGEAVSGAGYKEYRLGDYSTWLQCHVGSGKNWARIRSCLADAEVCRRLQQDKNSTLAEFLSGGLCPRLSPAAASLPRAATSRTPAARRGPRRRASRRPTRTAARGATTRTSSATAASRARPAWWTRSSGTGSAPPSSTSSSSCSSSSSTPSGAARSGTAAGTTTPTTGAADGSKAGTLN